MINSMYIISLKNSIILEKHWKHVTSKSICQQFLDVERNMKTKENISPIIASNKYSLIHLKESDIYYLAICEKEVSPLFVVEFLRRVNQVLEYYFLSVTELIIEENLIKIYEILDEMLDNGFPLITESNILEELIRPPNMLRAIADQVNRQNTNVSSILPVGQLSVVPWRRVGVKHPSNEAYFDFYEVIDAILDKNGNPISCDIVGSIKANIHLTGVPDLTMSFCNPKLIDDISLHSCVRYFKWEKDRVLSFIPPEGQFELCTYYCQMNSNISLPVGIKSLSKIDENRSYLDLTVIGNKINSKKSVENLCLTVHLPKIACNVVPKTCSIGKTKYNTSENTLTWNIGRLDQCVVATLKGPIILHSNSSIDETSVIQVVADFKIDQYTASGTSVNKVEVFNEKYSPYKGVKYATAAGKYQLRA